MKITKVCCQGCGADLQVDESVRYVTCNYCNARLEVVHDPSVTHTRLMEKLEKTTDRMAGNLRVIELQNDLERLDREWHSMRDRFMVTGKNGHRSLPTHAGSIVGAVVGVVFGVVWIGIASSAGAPGPMVLFGVLVVGMVIFGSIRGMSKAGDYQRAESAFQRRRAQLVRELDEARRP